MLRVTKRTRLSIFGFWELIRFLWNIAISRVMFAVRCLLRIWSNLANGVSIWWRAASCLPVGNSAW